MILEGLRLGRCRTIGLGRADDRYFTFCAGFGLDAAVIRRVEQARRRGRVSTPRSTCARWSAQYFLATDRRHPAITLERPGEPAEAELATVIIQNTAPWTYLGDRPINPNPDASFDLGLDVLALRQLHVPSTTRTVTQILSRQPDPHGRQVLRLHDVGGVHAGRPAARRRSSSTATTSASGRKSDSPPFPHALRVIC